MANTKISALTSGNPAQNTDLIPIDRAGSNFSITPQSIMALTPKSGVLPSFGEYTFSVSAGTVSATNNATGVVDYSGTDTTVVVNAVLAVLASTGGMLYFKNGIYPINSLIQETATGWTNYYYGIGIPTSSYSEGTGVEWHFEGESKTIWTGESGSASVQNNGVIFNVTSAALAGLAGSNIAIALWQKPEASGGFSATQVYFKNVGARFPTNTRGNEIGFGMYSAGTIDYEGCMADFAISYITIAAGSLPAAGSYGLTSSYSGAGALQHFKDTYATGFEYGYDVVSEHFVADTITSYLCKYAGILGRSPTPSSTPVSHPCVMLHVVDHECQNGWVLGSNMSSGSLVDIFGYAFEVTFSGAFSHVNFLYETNVGASSGTVTYTSTIQGNGYNTPTNPFSHGGTNFNLTVVPWSILKNATADLTLSNAGFNTTFNQTSSTDWKWTNTTAAASSAAVLVVSGIAQGSGGTVTLNTMGANLLVVVLSDFSASDPTVGDTLNSWNYLTTRLTGSSRIRIAYAFDAVVNPAHVFTITGVLAFGVVYAFSGAQSGAGVFDSENGNNGPVNSPFQPGSITPSLGDIVVTGFTNAQQTSNICSINSGFSTPIATTTLSNMCGAGSYLLGAAASPLNPTWTTVASANTAAIACFKAPASSISHSSPTIHLSGTYWNGSASATDDWTIQNVLTNSTNGASTLTFLHSGSSGESLVSFPNTSLNRISKAGSDFAGQATITAGNTTQAVSFSGNYVGTAQPIIVLTPTSDPLVLGVPVGYWVTYSGGAGAWTGFTVNIQTALAGNVIFNYVVVGRA